MISSSWYKNQGVKLYDHFLVQYAFWSVSNSFKWDMQSLAKYHIINFTGIGDNNTDKFTDYQILANTLILQLK